MPGWTPQPKWKDQDACIIGGGSSLLGFNFSHLESRNVIGVNDAFRLGSHIVRYCIFGDSSWFHKNKWELEKFTGTVVSCAPAIANLAIPWVHKMDRVREGLHTGPRIGWNNSTGAAAVNLAISLGATRIFLLGFDMGRRKQDGKTHWHTHQLRPVQDACYQRFIKGFANVYRGLAAYPKVKILNVTDGVSQLPYFPRIKMDVFLKYVPLLERVPCQNCAARAQEAQQRSRA